MISVNGVTIIADTFGDNTLRCDAGQIEKAVDNHEVATIVWCYDNDGEMFLLMSIIEHIRDINCLLPICLVLPYVPNARQDRKVSGRLFTLKAFAKFINSLNFHSVYVVDPHSDVTTALIDRVRSDVLSPEPEMFKNIVHMYPDAGAAKRYGKDDPNCIVGAKKRNEEGRVCDFELMNFIPGTKEVLIRDDICSYGGTFVAAAKALREKGVEKIYLYVTHCENCILLGEVFNYIDKVYTTDSICTVTHPKLEIIKHYRKAPEL